MRILQVLLMGLFAALPFVPALSQPVAIDLQSALLRLFRDGVVKVEVSSNTPVFQNGRNVCLSEGTGFLVSSSHAVTAEHVYNLPAECGDRIILLSSRRHNLQVRATVVDALNDVSLLKVEEQMPAAMCALVVKSHDVFNVVAFRYGIPGGLRDPSPEEGIRISERDVEFAPLVQLRPAIAEPGESGGPVIFMFNVVGVTRARHPTYRNHSVMTPSINIRELMTRNSVSLDGRICNPVLVDGFSPDRLNAGARIRIVAPIDDVTRQNVLANTAILEGQTAASGRRGLSVQLTGDQIELRTQEPEPLPLEDFGLAGYERSSGGPLRFPSLRGGGGGDGLIGRIEANQFVIRQQAQIASERLEENLWRKLVEQVQRNRNISD